MGRIGIYQVSDPTTKSSEMLLTIEDRAIKCSFIKARNVFLSGKAPPLWIEPRTQLPGVHNQPANAGRMPQELLQEHRPSTVDNFRLGDVVVVMFLSNSDVSKSLVETLDQRKHRAVQLFTEAPKTISSSREKPTVPQYGVRHIPPQKRTKSHWPHNRHIHHMHHKNAPTHHLNR